MIQEVIERWLRDRGFVKDLRRLSVGYHVLLRDGFEVWFSGVGVLHVWRREGDIWKSDFVICFGDPDLFAKLEEFLV